MKFKEVGWLTLAMVLLLVGAAIADEVAPPPQEDPPPPPPPSEKDLLLEVDMGCYISWEDLQQPDGGILIGYGLPMPDQSGFIDLFWWLRR